MIFNFQNSRLEIKCAFNIGRVKKKKNWDASSEFQIFFEECLYVAHAYVKKSKYLAIVSSTYALLDKR